MSHETRITTDRVVYALKQFGAGLPRVDFYGT